MSNFDDNMVRRALKLAKTFRDGLDGCEVNNSVIGSLMSLPPPVGFGVPRWATEAACRIARARLEASGEVTEGGSV